MGFRNQRMVVRAMIGIVAMISLFLQPSQITSVDRQPNLSTENLDLADNVYHLEDRYDDMSPQLHNSDTPEQPEIEWIDIRATAYTAKCRGCIGFTKTGYDVRRTVKYEGMGIISVDPRLIPLGSTVEIEGMGLFKAIDTGGAIKKNKIDVLVKTYDEAIEFGVKYVKLRIVEKGGEK